MDAFATLKEIWREAGRRRKPLALVAGFAILVGLLVAFRPGVPPASRQYEVWIASADILVDTSDTQVVDAKGPDPLTLANRASLLGNVIATESLRTAIATASDVPADHLVVVPPAPPSDGAPIAPMPVATAPGREIKDEEATVLTLSTDETLPILHVSAQAPSASTAGRLAATTLDQLERHLDSVAAEEQHSAAHQLVVRQLGVRPPEAQTRGTSAALGLIAALLVALLGGAAVVAAPMLARRWKQADAAKDRAETVDRGPTSLFGRTTFRIPPNEDGAQLETAAVATAPGAGSEGAGRATQRKKQSRQRRKHGRPR